MKTYVKVILAVLALVILIGAGGLYYISRNLETVVDENIKNIDLSTIEDGSYVGVYEAGRFSNELKIKVKDHRIIEITVAKDILISQPEVTEKLFDRVLKNQKVNVDVISEATVTSKAYLKSIENALSDKK
ncbi:MAG: FMN-binding protein [Halothermotrichaceae bacterium]